MPTTRQPATAIIQSIDDHDIPSTSESAFGLDGASGPTISGASRAASDIASRGRAGRAGRAGRLMLRFFPIRGRPSTTNSAAAGEWDRGSSVVRPAPGTGLVTLKTERGEKVVALFGPAQLPDGSPHPEAAKRPTLLYFYGNAMCLSDASFQFEEFRRLATRESSPIRARVRWERLAAARGSEFIASRVPRPGQQALSPLVEVF